MANDVSTRPDVLQMMSKCGQFGRFQVFLFAMSCVASFISAPVYVDWNIVSRNLRHRCYIPDCDEGSSCYESPFNNFTIPLEKSSDNSLAWDRCDFHPRINNYSESFVTTEDFTCAPGNFDSSTKMRCDEWVYDTSIIASTTVSEFNLVCDNAWLGPMAGTIYMLGMLLGAISIGDIADRFGRKTGLLISILLLGGGGFFCSISPNYYMFLFMRFFTGAGGVGLFQIAFILSVEYVGPKWRTFCGLMIEVPFALGEALVGVVAFYIRDWRWLQATLTAPAFLLISFMWLMPESIRWLVSKERDAEAMEIVEKIADFNGVEIPKHILKKEQEVKLSTVESSIPVSDSKAGLVEVDLPRNRTVMDLLRYPNMRKRTLNLFFCWAVCTVAYYGLSSNSGNLAGNLYINFIATMLIEIPSYVFAYLVLDTMGRKGTLVFTLFFGGIACLVSGFIPSEYNWLIITLAMLGKFGMSSAFGVIFIYSAEIFPSDYRCVGVGACSMCARVGGMLAPYISSLSLIYQPLPLMIFGILALISGCMIVTLPETTGSDLPQTIEDSERFGSDQPTFYFACCDRRKKEIDEENAT